MSHTGKSLSPEVLATPPPVLLCPWGVIGLEVDTVGYHNNWGSLMAFSGRDQGQSVSSAPAEKPSAHKWLAVFAMQRTQWETFTKGLLHARHCPVDTI